MVGRNADGSEYEYGNGGVMTMERSDTAMCEASAEVPAEAGSEGVVVAETAVAVEAVPAVAGSEGEDGDVAADDDEAAAVGESAAIRTWGGFFRRRLRGVFAGDDGMSTVEYAIGSIAAAAFGAILYTVVTGDSVVSALTGIIGRALSTSV